jgi:AraC family chitin signaling transcriptional activator
MQRIISILFFLVVSAIVSAQELPPIQNYGIADYEAGNQNWSISQSADKHIFFGNNIGLLEFDGARWTLYPSPNGTIVRAVQAVGDIVYSGCYMEFGYWNRDKFGTLKYTSLLDKLEQPLKEDEHFWNITAHDEWVLFQSRDRIYLYNTDNESIIFIDFDVSRAKIFNLGDEIFIQKNDGRLYSIQNGEAILESENPIFIDNLIVGIYKHQGKKIVITESGKFYFYDNGSLSEWSIGLNDSPNLYLYSTLQLKDGGFILGSISEGFIHLNKYGELIQRVNQEKGLENNTVLSLFQDAGENLWLGLDNGISNINLESAFRIYDDVKGALGVVYASLVVDDFLYLGTNQGLFFRKLNSSDEFALIEGTKGQVWSLKVIDNTVFCGHTVGTFTVKDHKARLIYNFSGTWNVATLTGHDHLLIQGNYNGLSILEKREGQWKFRNKIEGFDISSRAMILLDKEHIIVNHENKGLQSLVMDPGFTKIVKSEVIAPIGYDSSILKYDDKILYTSNEGVFDLDLNLSKLFINEFWTNIFYPKGDAVQGKLIVESESNKIWGFSENNIICMSIDKIDATPRKIEVPVPSSFRRNLGLTGFENVSNLNGETYLIGTSDGYVLIDLDKLREVDNSIMINSIQSEIAHSDAESMSLSDDLILPYDQNSIKFSFSVPEYNKYKEVVYQYQLNGYLERWSRWFK